MEQIEDLHFLACFYRQLGQEHNFDKHNLSDADTLSTSYDYGSVMHYARDAFSVNGSSTIIPKNSAASIGQRITLSPTDILQVQRFYECQTTTTTAPTGTENISLISSSRIPVPCSLFSNNNGDQFTLYLRVSIESFAISSYQWRFVELLLCG